MRVIGRLLIGDDTDHLDAGEAAAYLAAFKALIEMPPRLLV